jgi:hypothetical protein
MDYVLFMQRRSDYTTMNCISKGKLGCLYRKRRNQKKNSKTTTNKTNEKTGEKERRKWCSEEENEKVGMMERFALEWTVRCCRGTGSGTMGPGGSRRQVSPSPRLGPARSSYSREAFRLAGERGEAEE